MKKILTASVLSLLLLSGCGGTDSSIEALTTADVVGTWVENLVDGTETIVLREDMTYTKTIVLNGLPGETVTNDTYSLSGDKIIINYSKYSTTSEYTVSFEGNTMIWDSGDGEIVYTKS